MATTELILSTAVKGTEQATKALNEVKGSLDKVGESAKTIGSKFSFLKKGFEDSVDASKKLGVALIAVGTGGTIAFTKLSNSFTDMQNSLRQVSKTEEDLNKNQRKMLELANEARVPIEDLTKSFVRFDKINTQLGGNQAETAKMLSNLSKGLSLSGATAEEAGSAMLQLSQAFGSGKLQGDEFRSLAESMPMLLDILAKSMGVPRGELKKLAGEGKITSEILKKALLGATTEIEDAFAKSQASIGSALTVFKNNILVTFGELDKQYGITKKVVSAIGELSKSFTAAIPVIISFGEWIVKNKEIIVAAIAGAITPAIIGLGIAISGVMLRLAPFMLIGGLIQKNWDPIVETFNNVKNSISSAIEGIISFYQKWKTSNEETMRSISETFNKIKEIFSLTFGIIKTIISNDLAIIKMVWTAWGEEIKTILSVIFEVIKIIVSSAWESIKAIFQGGLDIIIGLLNIFKGIFTGDWKLVWESVKGIFSSAFDMLKKVFTNMMNGFQSILITIWNSIKADISAIVDTIVSYITLGFSKMIDKVTGYINTLEEKARQAKRFIQSIMGSYEQSTVGQSLSNFGSSAYDFINGTRASGGPVGGGQSYLVGEKGPEIFTPGVSGNIIPNNKIGGGSSIVIQISGVFGSDAAEEIGDMIVSKLKRASYV